jgi:hypothetical protein
MLNLCRELHLPPEAITNRIGLNRINSMRSYIVG